MKRFTWLACALALAATTPTAGAQNIRVTIENLQPSDGFAFTPVWLAFHDGGFDLFDAGSAVSPELELIAEVGMTGAQGAALNATTNADLSARYETTFTAPAGFPGAPVFEQGESRTQDLTVPNAGANQYLTFASMLIPTNDIFFGNGDPLAWKVFNADGSFAGPVTIDIVAEGLYDAGTETNDAGVGPAFVAGIDGALGGVEGGVATAFPGFDPSIYLGLQPPTGPAIADGIASGEAIARITITAVPEPSTLGLAAGAVALLGLVRRRMAA